MPWRGGRGSTHRPSPRPASNRPLCLPSSYEHQPSAYVPLEKTIQWGEEAPPIQAPPNHSPGQDRKQPREGTGLPKVMGR